MRAEKIAIVFCLFLTAALSTTAAEKTEKVVIRAANGKFLRAADHGSIEPVSWWPAAKETFELFARGPQQITLQATDGRYLASDARTRPTPRLRTGGKEPVPCETWELVPAGEDGFSLRTINSSRFLTFTPAGTPLTSPKKAADAKAAAGPRPAETVEIYRIRGLPAILATTLPAAIHNLAAQELEDKRYDQTRTHKIETYVDLPEPTLKDPKRKKRHQVLGLTGEYRVQAQLAGQAEVRLLAMPLLANYRQNGCGMILLVIDARLPIAGHVQGTLEKLASGSTGYQTTVRINAVAEVRVRRERGDVKISPPTVLDLHVSLADLKLSNDVLDVARRQIQQVVNHELQHNEPRIRRQANASLEKALASRDVRIPLLGYLGVL